MRVRQVACALIAGAAVCLPGWAGRVVARFEGLLGQSGSRDGRPIPWTEARWCARDAHDNVYLPGGWMVPRGETAPIRLSRCVDGALLFDGKTMYAWQRGRERMTLQTLAFVPGGLTPDGTVWTWRRWEWIPAVAPDGAGNGRTKRLKVAALDARGGKVFGWDAAGAELGVVVDFSSEPWATSACGIAFDPASGDVLISTRWEVRKVFRFGALPSSNAPGKAPNHSHISP